MAEYIIETNNLTKAFGSKLACDNVSMHTLYLIRTAEYVCIVLGETAYAGQSVQLTALLITIYCTKLSDAQRQVTV